MCTPPMTLLASDFDAIQQQPWMTAITVLETKQTSWKLDQPRKIFSLPACSPKSGCPLSFSYGCLQDKGMAFDGVLYSTEDAKSGDITERDKYLFGEAEQHMFARHFSSTDVFSFYDTCCQNAYRQNLKSPF